MITIFTNFVFIKCTFSILNLILNNMESRSPSKGKMANNVTKQLGLLTDTYKKRGQGAEDICRLSHLQDLEETCSATDISNFSLICHQSEAGILTHHC